MTVKRYNDEEQEAFIELAQTEGIGKAMRLLGYPGSWKTGMRWFEVRSIEPPVVSEVHAMANAMKEAVGDKEKLAIGQQGLERMMEIMNTDNLSADDIKKCMEAYQKAINTMNLIEGKSTEVVDNRYSEATPELQTLLNEQEEKNVAKAERILSNS